MNLTIYNTIILFDDRIINVGMFLKYYILLGKNSKIIHLED